MYRACEADRLLCAALLETEMNMSLDSERGCTFSTRLTKSEKFIVIALYVSLLNPFCSKAALHICKPLIHCMLLTYLASRGG